MIAEFYLIPDSFAVNQTISISEVEERTKSLASDFVYIKKYKDTNKFFVHSDIYNVQFIQDTSLSDLLFNSQQAKKKLDRDVFNALQKIVVESATTDIPIPEVIEVLLPEHNPDLCHGLIGFNSVEGVNPEFQLIYNLSGWLDFRRHFLSIYPKNQAFFIDECIKYFPNIHFHERNKTTVGTILHNCSKKIIYHLKALNNDFKGAQQIGLNRSQVLAQFSITAALDETASLEGNASRKPDLTFKFQNSSSELEDVCCEPHLKLCYNDFYPGDSSYSTDRRIYFHEGKSNIANGKILIGHIGDHL